MKIIEKIEIKNFRSFLGTTKNDKAEVLDLTSLNIFSGSNDSGKSNLLRVLNLFFNDEISIDDKFIFERDFPKQKINDYQRVVEIRIYFDLSEDSTRDRFLPEKFSISKFYAQDGNNEYRDYLLQGQSKQGQDIKIFTNPDKNKNTKSEKQYRQHLWGFLNKLSFEYVPAIKDKFFFKRLFGRAILGIKEQEDQEVKKLKVKQKDAENWKATIKRKEKLIKTREEKIKRNLQRKKHSTWRNEIESLKIEIENYNREEWRNQEFKSIESTLKNVSVLQTSLDSLKSDINNFSTNLFTEVGTFLPSEFQIGEDLSSFFEEFDIGTGYNKNISLRLRGDGIQAKFIPEVLDFVSSNQINKKYFIWGIEEPENSSEYKNQQELAIKLKEIFSKSKQIFLTTHSEEFLSLYDDINVKKDDRQSNLYHIKKVSNKQYEDFSIIELFNVEKEVFDFASIKSDIENNLGTSQIRAKYSKELKKSEDMFLSAKKEFEQHKKNLENKILNLNKPILFVEDKYDQIYKVAWLKINGISFDENTLFDVFEQYSPFAIFSTEGASGLQGFLQAQNIDYWKNKKVIGLFDFDEAGREKFNLIKSKKEIWNSNLEGEKTTGLLLRRLKHDCFCAMLIPVPKKLTHLADISHPSYIEIENLLPSKFLVDKGIAIKRITTGKTKYFEIQDSKKPCLWKSLCNLPKQDFINFEPLFMRINEIFKIN